jgi:plasmid maintenance system antidote protein VapI
MKATPLTPKKQSALTPQKRLRLALMGRSKRAIARKLGMSPSHVNRVLNGQRDCSVPMAKRLAAELGLDVSTFISATMK